MKSLQLAALALGIFAVFSFSKIGQKTETPPNGFALDENLFCDKTEITNQDWREYVYWNARIFGENSPQHKASLPDTTAWLKDLDYFEPMVSKYFSHPAFSSYPVVGVSQAQAQSYTQWRTDRYFEVYLIRLKKIKSNTTPDATNHFTTARFFAGEIEDLKPELTILLYPKFMLPNTVQQGEIASHAAKIDGDYYNSYNFEKPVSTKGLSPLWIANSNNLVHKIGPTRATANKEIRPFKNNYPYHIYDNVAEWSSQPNVAFGSSWHQNIGAATAIQTTENGAVSAYIGFRNICSWQNFEK